MLRLVSDENFNGDIIRGLRLRLPNLDLVRWLDVGGEGADDAVVLAWAAQNERIVLTHDRTTFPRYAFERVEAGDAMPGVFVVNDRMPIGQAITELLIVDACSEQGEWIDRVLYFPL
jgi:hypothetical protein